MDSKGLMWMGSDLGLDRYDGYRVTSYNTENGSLLFNRFHALAEDGFGRIWLGFKDSNHENDYTIQLFDPISKKASWWNESVDISALKQEKIKSIHNDQYRQQVWVVANRSVFLFDEGGVLKKVYSSSKPITDAEVSVKGLWIRVLGEFLLVDPKGQVNDNFEVDPFKTYEILGTDSFSRLYTIELQDSEGLNRNIIYRNGKLFKVDEKYLWSKHLFLSINPDQDLIFTLFDNQIFMVDLEQNLIDSFSPQPHFFTHPFQAYFDSRNNWWVPFNKEVHIAGFEKNKFKSYLEDFLIFGEIGFGARAISPLNSKELLISGLGGTYILNKETNETREFDIPPSLFSGSSLDKFRRLDILSVGDSLYYLSTEGNKIYAYNKRRNQFGLVQSEESIEEGSMTDDGIDMNWCMIQHNGEVWIGQGKGLSIFKLGEKIYSKFNRYNQYSEVANVSVYDFFQDDNLIWLGTDNGLYLLEPGKGIVKKANLKFEEFNDNPAVLDINSFDHSTLHLATRNGIVVYDIDKDGVTSWWNEKAGLSDNTTYAIYQDEFSRLWVPTNKGINVFDPKTGTTRVFNQDDGVAHNEFNTISHYQDADGRLYFGNLNGITSFHPKDFPPTSEKTAGLMLSSLRFQKKKSGIFEDYDLSEIQELVMEPGMIGMELKFGIQDYLNPQLKSFAYRIEGLDNDWSYAESPEIRINRLPYGEYNLMVKAQGGNGALYSPRNFVLKVIRPFYFTWWFVTLLALAVVAMVVLIIRYRERLMKERQKTLETEIDKATIEIRKQSEELKSLDKLKSNFFANISHELKTPLSLILAPLEKTLNQQALNPEVKSDLALAQRNAVSVGNLVNEILDLTRLENGVAQPRYNKVQVNSFLKLLTDNFAPKAQSTEINLSYESNLKEDDSWGIDRNMTEKIMNNLLSNALRHTLPKGEVQVTVRADKDLIIEVRDTGTGISEEDLPYIFDRFFQTKDPSKKAEGGTGIGLALSNELAQVMNGDLQVESQPGMGSTFTLTLPPVELTEPAQSQSVTFHESGEFPNLVNTRFNLLLVDDNDEIRDFIKSNLDKQFEILTAEDGQEALEILTDKNLTIHMVISDMMMPKMDGIELLEKLKMDEATQNIPVIFLTARTAERDKIEAFRVGVDDYLTKPFSLDELRARIKNQLKIALQRRNAQGAYEEEPNIVHSLTENEAWLKQLRQMTEQQVNSVDFSISSLAEKLGMSERTLFRKINKLTGYSPNVYLKEIRLQMARRMLERKLKTDIGSVAQEIGFTSSKYFSRLFKERFGKSPSEYLN